MFAKALEFSSDARSVNVPMHSRNAVKLGGAMSTEATDDFSVRITNELFKDPKPDNGVFIGFTTRTAWFNRRIGPLFGVDEYTLLLWSRHGTLCVAGKVDTPYCEPFVDVLVRGVVDREHGTISFYVDGVDCGVAWSGVEATRILHATVTFCRPGVTATLV